jgi:hypothetical protein
MKKQRSSGTGTHDKASILPIPHPMQGYNQKNQREDYGVRPFWSCFHGRRRVLQFLILIVVIMHVFVGSGNCDFEIQPTRDQASPGTSSRSTLIGSSPPDCRSKCSRCTPCVSVLVPIHPGTVIPQNYYPQVWRCKCRDRLYNP